MRVFMMERGLDCVRVPIFGREATEALCRSDLEAGSHCYPARWRTGTRREVSAWWWTRAGSGLENNETSQEFSRKGRKLGTIAA